MRKRCRLINVDVDVDNNNNKKWISWIDTISINYKIGLPGLPDTDFCEGLSPWVLHLLNRIRDCCCVVEREKTSLNFLNFVIFS